MCSLASGAYEESKKWSKGVIYLTLIMPFYNEEKLLESAASEMLDALKNTTKSHQLILVDDGSRDQSARIAKKLETRYSKHVKLLTHAHNQGFGAAMKTGIANAEGEFCMIIPVDCPLSANEIKPFLEKAPQADLVLGYRPERRGYNWIMKMNTRFYHSLLRSIYGITYRDVNWIQLYRTKIFSVIEITTTGVMMLAEVVIKAQYLHFRIAEIPCEMKKRIHGTPSAARFKVMQRTARQFVIFFVRWFFDAKHFRPISSAKVMTHS